MNKSIHTHQIRTVQFWPGYSEEVDIDQIVSSAVPVKGKQYHLPLRFLEIYANLPLTAKTPLPKQRQQLQWREIQEKLMPKIPGINVYLGDNIDQPPFKWQQCDGTTLCINFTYNVNAIYRIFSNLAEQALISPEMVDNLVDQACLLLAQIYKMKNYFVMRQINNNFNMFFISKVVEALVGREVYNSEFQEYKPTYRALLQAIDMVREHKNLSIKEKIGLALAKGVTFTESRFSRGISKSDLQNLGSITYRYFHRELAIDDREMFIGMIENALGEGISMVAILDDTAETIEDLFWMQDLLVKYPRLNICLLVNPAQISINFSSQMLPQVLSSSIFAELANRLGSQFSYIENYSPFISFQTNFLQASARNAISKANIIYVKGANFFETCQIPEKDTFYGFIVYGPISRRYTGLKDFDAVFAYVPKGQTGYINDPDITKLRTLKDICRSRNQSSGGSYGCI